MKRKDYKVVSPEPKDYGGSDYSDDRSPSSWAAAGGDDSYLYYGKRCPRRRFLKAPTAAAMTTAVTMVTTVATTTVEILVMTTLLGCFRCVVRACRHSISQLYASVDECFQA
jgi:hypothetical protein